MSALAKLDEHVMNDISYNQGKTTKRVSGLIITEIKCPEKKV